MHALAAKYSKDMDAAALYAESLMDLRPWALWTSDGKPAPGTDAATPAGREPGDEPQPSWVKRASIIADPEAGLKFHFDYEHHKAIITFNDFSLTLPANKRGTFASYSDPGSNNILVTSYTTDGKPAEIQRTLANGTSPIIES